MWGRISIYAMCVVCMPERIRLRKGARCWLLLAGGVSGMFLVVGGQCLLRQRGECVRELRRWVRGVARRACL